MTIPKKISILGLGRTGRALVEALSGRFELFLSESRRLSPAERTFLEKHGVRFEEGGHSPEVLRADLVVPSPGVPPHTPVLQEAVQRKIPIWSEIELAFRLAEPSMIFAVTGTNGKSTTTELIGAILRAWGLEPVVAGNIGRPAIGTLEEVRGKPWVLEVSSFQLLWTKMFRPTVAIWLNFAPDHLDYHGSLAAYFAAKARIFRCQLPSHVAVVSREVLTFVSPKAFTVVIEEVMLPSGWGQGLPEHLQFNLRAAWAAASLAFPQREPPAYESLWPILHGPHRLERVGEIRGIPFVNDSKGTNAHATCAALQAIPGPVVLILGGRHKGGGYDALAPLLRQKVRSCVLIGESQPFFSQLLSTWGVPFICATDPADALYKAYQLAQPGDTVLLSPACASFDQFRDYAHRGEVFKDAFHRMKG
ncbi:MAG: UDP-N-acetylmuramoyl-L-alanine--D-glutamate ligase [Candidatus Bipolaricaulota bacterium]|nr:UDP-N-acetylmuramoyl-L-alanine--D-glutamate ligase [Candidatus Bipolaricaulota bacterium]MDW8127256.1 UDP-N-acetylmuramoyl-L-alanine--D-glutamate ligase [Candidatus Bipolaricaulota bacterium]